MKPLLAVDLNAVKPAPGKSSDLVKIDVSTDDDEEDDDKTEQAQSHKSETSGTHAADHSVTNLLAKLNNQLNKEGLQCSAETEKHILCLLQEALGVLEP